MRIEVKLKENHSGEFVVFLLKGSHDEVLIFENYSQCILTDGVIYLTKNGDINRGDVPKLKAASDGLYSLTMKSMKENPSKWRITKRFKMK